MYFCKQSKLCSQLQVRRSYRNISNSTKTNCDFSSRLYKICGFQGKQKFIIWLLQYVGTNYVVFLILKIWYYISSSANQIGHSIYIFKIRLNEVNVQEAGSSLPWLPSKYSFIKIVMKDEWFQVRQKGNFGLQRLGNKHRTSGT